MQILETLQACFEKVLTALARVRRSHTLLLAGACVVHLFTVAQAQDTEYQRSRIQEFTDDELRDLVVPIALYPDALLAQVLPASAYPLDIVAAYRHSQDSTEYNDPPEGVDWDSSVVALLHFPSVLKRMSEDIYWTERLGVAVTYQMPDVSEMIQQVRVEANAAGNLVSNSKQNVSIDGTIILIVPANPRIIYVPTYEPDVIFERHNSWEPFISFGVGFGVGLWLSNDFDWRYHRIGINNYWHRGRWGRRYGRSYWRAPYRSIPTWYLRGGFRSSSTLLNFGYQFNLRDESRHRDRRNSRYSPRRTQGVNRTSRAANRSGSSTRPTRSIPASSRATLRLPNAPPTHAESLGRNRRQVWKESNRGFGSRRHVTPATNRGASTNKAPNRSRSHNARGSTKRDEQRPGNGSESRRESSRGKHSRGNKKIHR